MIDIIFWGVPVMMAQFIGGPFDGGVFEVQPGTNMVEMPSMAGRWTHYYAMVDGRLEYLGRSDGIEKEVSDATGV